MKYKITALLLVFACLCGSVMAQEENMTEKKKRKKVELPQAGDFGLGIDVIPMFSYIGNFFNGTTNNKFNSFGGEPVIGFKEPINSPTVSIMGKYMITENWAARANVGMLFTHKSDRSYSIDDAALVENPLSQAKVIDEAITNNTGASFSVGAEYRRGYRRIQGFVGGNLIYAFSKYDKHYTYGNALTNVNQMPSRIEAAEKVQNAPSYWTQAYLLDYYNDGSAQYVGIGAHIGVEIFLASHFSLGGEVSINAIWQWGPEVYQKSEGFNMLTNSVEEYTELISPGSRNFSFGTENLGGKLYLMFYF